MLRGPDRYFTRARAEFVRYATENIRDCYSGRISIPTDSFMSAIAQSTEVKIRACPLCGAVERKVLERREPWEIVECAACGMVFIGSELAYEVQARDFDWDDEHSKEAERRKRKQPFFVFMSRVLKPLRPDTNGRMLSQTLRWATWEAGGFRLRRRRIFVAGKAVFRDDGNRAESAGRGNFARSGFRARAILEGPVTRLRRGCRRGGSTW